MKSVAPILLFGSLSFTLAHAGVIDAPAISKLEGYVIGVTDGDTLTILSAAKEKYQIRLASIDAPETKCYSQKVNPNAQCAANSQPFGVSSKQSLADKVFNKNVSVVINQKGSYGRYVGTVYLNGVDVNLSQVAAGMAWHETRFVRFQAPADVTKYSAAEQSARAARIGLWADSQPEAPWVYRKRLKSKQ